MSTVGAVSAILANAGVADHDGRLVSQLVDFACTQVANLTDEAKALAELAGRQQVLRDDVLLAAKYSLDQAHTNAPPRQVAVQLAANINATPLPAVKHAAGLRLPADRYCLLKPAYQLKPTAQLAQVAQQHRQQPPIKIENSQGSDGYSVDFHLSDAGASSAKRVHLDDDYDA